MTELDNSVLIVGGCAFDLKLLSVLRNDDTWNNVSSCFIRHTSVFF